MNRTLPRRSVLGLLGVGGCALLAWPPRAEADARRFPMQLSPAEWRRRLPPQRFAILREAGTERPFSSPLDKEHRRGTFRCAGCALPLFASAAKFDSGTGWPSFTRPVAGRVGTKPDRGWLGVRTECHCGRCGGHLGHVFDDGPRPTGQRWCINGVALGFVPAKA